MKISAVRPLVLGTLWRDLTFVIVETDEGLRGVGESRMVNHAESLLGYLREASRNHILGSHPFEIEDLVQRMFRRDYARAVEIMTSAIAIIEMNCWDIMGQALGVTLNEAFVAEHPPKDAFFDLFAENWHQRRVSTRDNSAQCPDPEADNG
jgi:galactonate dehydratase